MYKVSKRGKQISSNCKSQKFGKNVIPLRCLYRTVTYSSENNTKGHIKTYTFLEFISTYHYGVFVCGWCHTFFYTILIDFDP